MNSTVTTCDRCQARCDGTASMFALKRPGAGDFSDRDLCPDCHIAFQSWFLAPTMAPTPEPPAEGDQAGLTPPEA